MNPPSFDSSRKHPLILAIHGGPFANHEDRLDVEKQLMAAHGYVVLYAGSGGGVLNLLSSRSYHPVPGGKGRHRPGGSSLTGEGQRFAAFAATSALSVLRSRLRTASI